jgi:hypothetical protein
VREAPWETVCAIAFARGLYARHMRKAIGVSALVALLGCLMWIGAELHYRNCVDAAVATTPAPERGQTAQQDIDNLLNGVPASPDISREAAVAACSRLRSDRLISPPPLRTYSMLLLIRPVAAIVLVVGGGC